MNQGEGALFIGKISDVRKELFVENIRVLGIVAAH
jgi:hypothetical protein